MKIFISGKRPNALFCYKVLIFLCRYMCRDEIEHYLDIIEREKVVDKNK